MPNHALFYPDWDISDPVFLAESLLYWDRLACIVPFSNFNPKPWHEDNEMGKAMAEAHERYIFPLVPTDEQKKRAHERIEAFALQLPPEWCRPANLKPERRQIFSAYKFAPQTIELLRNSGWAHPVGGTNKLDLQVIADSAANVLLSVLADECGSETMPPITDDPGSFVASCNSLLSEIGSPSGITREPKNANEPMPAQEGELGFLLARIPHFGFETGTVDLRAFRNLLKARNDPEIDAVRQSFRKKVDEYLKELRLAEGGERELIGLEFRREFEADGTRFQRELKRCGLDAIASKEGAVAVVAGIVAGVLNPGLGLAFGLAGGLVSHRRKRREIFEKHWSSWVFSNRADRFSVW